MYRKLTRSALLLALMIVLQSLRMFIPVPPFVSMFIIGSTVNACLLVAVEIVGWRPALVLAVAAPVVAYLQQVLALPIFIIPVAIGNAIYVLGYRLIVGKNLYLGVGCAAVLKMISLYFSVSWILKFVDLPAKLATILQMMMSWPQLVTGVIGGILCTLVVRRLGFIKN